MTISTNGMVYFGTLKNGDVFMCGNAVVLKLNDYTVTRLCLENVSINAVNLRSGELMKFLDNELVLPLELDVKVVQYGKKKDS